MATYGRQIGTGSGSGSGAASWISTQLTRAQALSARIVTPWHETFLTNPGLNSLNQQIAFGTIVSLSGAVTKQVVPGGVYRLSTGTTANATAMLTSPNNSGDQLVYNPAAAPFYLAFRMRFRGAAFSTEQKYFGAFTNTFNDYVLGIIANGAVSLVFKTAAVGTTTQNATSYTADYANGHDYGIGFDGTTLALYVDGAVVPGCSTTSLGNLTTANLWLGVYTSTGGTTSSDLDVDDMAYLCTQSV